MKNYFSSPMFKSKYLSRRALFKKKGIPKNSFIFTPHFRRREAAHITRDTLFYYLRSEINDNVFIVSFLKCFMSWWNYKMIAARIWTGVISSGIDEGIVDIVFFYGFRYNWNITVAIKKMNVLNPTAWLSDL